MTLLQQVNQVVVAVEVECSVVLWEVAILAKLQPNPVQVLQAVPQKKNLKVVLSKPLVERVNL